MNTEAVHKGEIVNLEEAHNLGKCDETTCGFCAIDHQVAQICPACGKPFGSPGCWHVRPVPTSSSRNQVCNTEGCNDQ